MGQKEPLVTIAIPFYNAERFIDFSIRSVLNQTYTNWELILLDDGSCDNSVSVSKHFKDTRILLISDGKNLGLATRLNQLSSMARGKYLARMDADDIMAVNRIERQVAFLETHPEIDLVGASAMIIDAGNHIIRSCNMDNVKDSFIHPTVMGKTRWFVDNPYDGSLMRSQDYELWLRTAPHSHFYNIKEPLLFYREFGVPSLKKNLKSLQSLRSIYKRYMHYGKTYGWFIKNFLMSYLKGIAYVILSLFNLQNLWMRSRKRVPLPIEEVLTSVDLERSILA